MSRTLILITLLVALVGMALLAFLISGGGGGARTGHKEEAIEERFPDRKRDPGQESEAGEAKAPGNLTLVEVRVGDTAGNAIEGALIRALMMGGPSRQETRTGIDGRAVLSLFPHAWNLDAIAEGFLPESRPCRIPEPEREPLVAEFRLEPAATLAGFVRDQGGAPVADAQLYLISPEHALLDRPEPWQQTASGADGRYVFPGVREGTWDLGARKWGYLPAIERDIEVKSLGRIERDVRVTKGRTLRVVVNNPGEATLVLAGDARLRDMLLPPGGLDTLAGALVGRGLAGLPVERDWQSFEGRYEIAGLPQGPLDVTATDVFRVTEPGLGSVEGFAGTDLTLTLLDGRRLTMFVFDAATRAPVECELRYRVDGTDRVLPLAVFDKPGDETGQTYAVVPTDPARRKLVFSAEGYQPAEATVPASDTGEVLEVEMVPIAEGETGSFLLQIEPELKPLSRIALVGRDAEGQQAWVKHVSAPDGEGRWRVEGVPVGTYDVSVLATRRIPGLLERVVVSRNLEQTHRVVLSEGAGMAMRVTGPDDELLDEVHIWLKDVEGRRIDLHILSEVSGGRGFLSVNYLPSAAAARSDSGLAPGVYTLTAYREGYETGTEEFVVSMGEENAVSVTLRPR